MAKKPDGTGPQKPAASASVNIILDEPEPGELHTIGGSQSDRFNNDLIRAMVKTSWFAPGQPNEDRDQQITVAVIGMQAFKPVDEIEGMLAAQAMAMHHASMECSHRAMLAEQPFECAQALRKAAANASRSFVELLSALDRKRGKGGQQVVRVEHVHVHPGGQAIVGNLATAGTGGGGAREMREKPRAPAQLEHAPVLGTVIPALLRKDPECDLVPVAGDAERSMPDPRRRQHRA